MSNDSIIRAGIVGCGFMARTYSLALRAVTGLNWPQLPAVELVRAADADPEPARRAAAAWGWREAVDDWRRVTRADDIDLVLVLTPNNTHAEIAIDAFDHGKHVLCEKPLASNLADARRMLKCAQSSARIHQVGFVYRKWPAASLARDLIASGEIGDILHYRSHYFHDYALDPDMPLSWRLQKAVSGGGSGADIGSHVIDLARYLAGEIGAVCARSRTVIERRPLPGRPEEYGVVDVDDITDMLVEFAAGFTGTLQTNWVATGHKTDFSFAVSGSRGAVEFSWERANEVRVYSTSDPAPTSGFRTIALGPAHRGAESYWPVAGLGLGFGDGFTIAVRDLLHSIAAGVPAEPDFLDGMRAAEVVDAAQRSAQTRAFVNVERRAGGGA